MNLNRYSFKEHGYREGVDNKINNKNYIASYYKEDVKGISIDIGVFKSIRGGVLFIIKYYFDNIVVYQVEVKESSICDIESVAIYISSIIGGEGEVE